MIIDCISDLHGNYPKLEGGDLLIVAGDLTARDTWQEHDEFESWLRKQYYIKKAVIAGNHDNYLNSTISFPYSYFDADARESIPWADYLCDSGTEFEGLKIWGSPWTKRFVGENPKCLAFTCETEEELAEYWTKIPEDTDILITHSPPLFGGDMVKKNNQIEFAGSKSLGLSVAKFRSLKLHVFGHIHESYGIVGRDNGEEPYAVNASYVNERYEQVNKPVRIEL